MASWVTFISKSHASVREPLVTGMSAPDGYGSYPANPAAMPGEFLPGRRVQPAVTGTGGSSSMSRSLVLSGKAQRSRTTQAGQSGLRALQM